MNDVAHIESTDTLRPPPPEMPRAPKPRRTKAFAVTVRCEDEQQRAMLVDWLAEAGFAVES
jgi:hypothetical protein